MLYRRRLRSRIILSFLLFGTLLSGLFAISTLYLQSTLEDELIGSTLKQELDDYLVQLRKDPTLVEPFHTRIQGFITRPGDPNHGVTAKIRELGTGVHEVETTEGYFKAAVRKDFADCQLHLACSWKKRCALDLAQGALASER